MSVWHSFVTMVYNPSISGKNKDVEKKLLGYDHGGLSNTFMRSQIYMPSNYPVRNPQYIAFKIWEGIQILIKGGE